MGGFYALVIGIPLICLGWIAIVNRIRPRPRFYWLWDWASVPASFIVLILCAQAVYYYESLPTIVFQKLFHFEPTADVKIVYSSDSFVIDRHESCLEFYADRPTIDRIIANGFTRVPAKDIKHEDSARWCGDISDGDTQYYAEGIWPGSERHRYFAQQTLIYEPSAKKAYYRGIFY